MSRRFKTPNPHMRRTRGSIDPKTYVIHNETTYVNAVHGRHFTWSPNALLGEGAGRGFAIFGSLMMVSAGIALAEYHIDKGHISLEDFGKYIRENKNRIGAEAALEGKLTEAEVAKSLISFGDSKTIKGAVVGEKRGPDGSEGDYGMALPQYYAVGIRTTEGDVGANKDIAAVLVNWSSQPLLQGLRPDYPLKALEDATQRYGQNDLL
ncbi:MAG: hypothetical protein HY366_01880 [Candidatus Aenigmarchaeota archaeon]|nr:hypothetical protein [Candidatus Aenigmarchaeota archaeon]